MTVRLKQDPRNGTVTDENGVNVYVRHPLVDLVFQEVVKKDEKRFMWKHSVEITQYCAALAKLLRDKGQDDEAKGYADKIATLLERAEGQSFDWVFLGATRTDGLFHVSYTPKDRAEFLVLRGDLKHVGQTTNSFVSFLDLRFFDRATGVGTVVVDDNRFGAIRSDEIRMLGLPVVTLKDVPFDPTTFPAPWDERKPGCWSK